MDILAFRRDEGIMWHYYRNYSNYKRLPTWEFQRRHIHYVLFLAEEWTPFPQNFFDKSYMPFPDSGFNDPELDKQGLDFLFKGARNYMREQYEAKCTRALGGLKWAEKFDREARARGYRVIRNGFPDRVIIKNGKVTLVELKTFEDKLKPHQVEVHKILCKLGINVVVAKPDFFDDIKSKP